MDQEMGRNKKIGRYQSSLVGAFGFRVFGLMDGLVAPKVAFQCRSAPEAVA